jgi:bacteriorhodopsin
MDNLVVITQYLFLVTMLGMLAGTIFFWFERESLSPEYRGAATVAGIYTGIAGFMYYKMHTIVGTSGELEALLALPTYYRYMDWILTTPLMLLNIALLLQLADDKRGVVGILLGADIVMIITGFFGELYANQPGRGFETWTLFVLSCLAWLMMLYIMYGILTDTARDKVMPVRNAFIKMRLFITIGWTIYPIGFMIGALSDAAVAKVLRELIYNIADLINKVGLGLVAILAARAITRDIQIREAMRQL